MPDEEQHEASGSLRVTADSVDPAYHSPVVGTSELRDDPVPHHYVNGRFDGRARGSRSLAFAEDVGPFPIAFDVATGDLGFTFDSGAYYAQTNLGGTDRMPPANLPSPRTGSTPPPRSTRGSSRANCSAVAALTGTCTAAAAAPTR